MTENRPEWDKRASAADFYVYGDLGMGLNMEKLLAFIRAEKARSAEEERVKCASKLSRMLDYKSAMPEECERLERNRVIKDCIVEVLTDGESLISGSVTG